ncbi:MULTISPECIES: hypothetical protein [unclassified Methanoculleus]|jgi:hypothetical protein|nr:hypothetical protein [Methanoculleus sp. UBA377]MDD2473785.1 hypothetical protein [Methanoculleus sp.]
MLFRAKACRIASDDAGSAVIGSEPSAMASTGPIPNASQTIRA